MNSFLTALRFLTILPLPGKREVSLGDAGKSLVFFPVVGLLIGASLAFLSRLLRYLLPTSVVSALSVTFLAAVSGFLHMDGFIDTCDSMAGHKTAEERLRMMKDTHVGAFGVAGGALLLLLKYASLNSLPSLILTRTLLITPAISRWLVVFAVFAYPYARPHGLGAAFKQGLTPLRFALATGSTILFVLLLAGPAGLIVTFGAWLIALTASAYFKSRLTGLTGDSYGAINEIAELSVLMLATIFARRNLTGWFSLV